MIRFINKYLTVWQGRITLGLAFFAAIVVGLAPDHGREIDVAKLIACIVTGLTWLTSEIMSAATVSLHDKTLFERINSVINDDALTFLLEHDFGHDLHSSKTQPISMVAEWHGPNYIFNDKAIQGRWQILFDKIVHLSRLYGDSLSTSSRDGILTAWLHGFSRHNQPQRAKDEVKALNDAASQVYQEFGRFALYVRKRLEL